MKRNAPVEGSTRSTWTFLTNHAHVLRCVAENPQIRLRDIAAAVGITERAAFGILDQLVTAGYVSRTRVGRRNEYLVRAELPLRHPMEREHHVGALLRALGQDGAPDRTGYAAAVLAAARDGIVVRDGEGRILDANPAFCELTGLRLDELVGRMPPFPYWPQGETDGLDMVEELRRHGATERAMTFRRADGAPLDVVITAAPFRTEAGLEGFVETVRAA